MIITAPTYRQILITLRELGLESTKAYLKRKNGRWVWKAV